MTTAQFPLPMQLTIKLSGTFDLSNTNLVNGPNFTTLMFDWL